MVLHNGQRTLTAMRWALVPSPARSWRQARKIGHSTFNARAESLDTAPAFRAAWRQGCRCLVIADGYYEWRDSDKQPFAVALGNRGPMTFAGLWDQWTAPEGEAVRSFAIITTVANTLLQSLHARMPVLLTPDHWSAWLGETAADQPQLRAMLRPYPDAGMAFWPVDRRVGNVRNDSPDLFTPSANQRAKPCDSPCARTN